MRQIRGFVFIALIVAALAGCGGNGDGDKSSGEPLNQEAVAACEGTALADAPNLPEGFPKPDATTYTKEHEEGPTQVVEGYFAGSVEDAHDEYKSGFESAGFTVLFDEVEDNDSEVSWKGKGRSGQVALRNECGENDQHLRSHHEPTGLETRAERRRRRLSPALRLFQAFVWLRVTSLGSAPAQLGNLNEPIRVCHGDVPDCW